MKKSNIKVIKLMPKYANIFVENNKRRQEEIG